MKKPKSCSYPVHINSTRTVFCRNLPRRDGYCYRQDHNERTAATQKMAWHALDISDIAVGVGDHLGDIADPFVEPADTNEDHVEPTPPRHLGGPLNVRECRRQDGMSDMEWSDCESVFDAWMDDCEAEIDEESLPLGLDPPEEVFRCLTGGWVQVESAYDIPAATLEIDRIIEKAFCGDDDEQHWSRYQLEAGLRRLDDEWAEDVEWHLGHAFDSEYGTDDFDPRSAVEQAAEKQLLFWLGKERFEAIKYLVGGKLPLAYTSVATLIQHRMIMDASSSRSNQPVTEGAQTVELSEYVGHDDLLQTKGMFQHMLQEDIVPSFLVSEPSLDQDELDALNVHLSNDYQNDEWVENVVKTAYINAIAEAIEDVDTTGEPADFDTWRSSDQRSHIMDVVVGDRLIGRHLKTIAETELADATADFTSRLPRYNS